MNHQIENLDFAWYLPSNKLCLPALKKLRILVKVHDAVREQASIIKEVELFKAKQHDSLNFSMLSRNGDIAYNQ